MPFVTFRLAHTWMFGYIQCFAGGGDPGAVRQLIGTQTGVAILNSIRATATKMKNAYSVLPRNFISYYVPSRNIVHTGDTHKVVY